MSKKLFPVVLSFDVDGQTLWTSRDPENFNRPVTLSLGNYGLYEGVPRILKLLRKYQIKASFMIPGMIGEMFPDVVKDIHLEGHEIGNHGYSHIHPETFKSKEEEVEEYVKTSEILEKLTGERPKGFRSPAWEFSLNTADILEEMGFLYSSNMMHTEKVHRLKVFDRYKSLIEIPIHWAMDDAAYWLYSSKLIGKSMQPLEAVENVWKSQFDVLYDEFLTEEGSVDTCYVLTLHPQVIGLPPRIKVLERVIDHIRQSKCIEFMTLEQLAQKHIGKLSE